MRPPPTRPTIRLPAALAGALQARVGAGGSLSDVVRQALAAFLGVCPTPEAPLSDMGRVTSDTGAALSDIHARLATLEQVTDLIQSDWLTDLTARFTQVEQVLAAVAARVGRSDAACPTPQAPEAFDATKYRLGRLCDQRHDYAGTGQTLRRVPSGVCPQCDTAAQRTRRAARRNGARAPQAAGNGAGRRGPQEEGR